MVKISCVLICCNSEKEKGNSVYHSLLLIFSQKYSNFEVIVVENSKDKTLARLAKLGSFIRKLNSERRLPVNFKILSYKNQINVNTARNRGVSQARGETIIFIEDDTILMSDEYFSKIVNYAKKYDFGFGAIRLWTKIGWFQNNSDLIFKKLTNKLDFKFFGVNLGEIPKEYKNRSDGNLFEVIQGRSFIANFGFVKRQAFIDVNGFPVYRALDLSDDCLMYRLWNSSYKFKSLKDLSVIHVSHFRNRLNNTSNINRYSKELISNGHFWCHLYDTFKPKFDPEAIIEKLQSSHYDYRLCEMYQQYCEMTALNLNISSAEFRTWKSRHQYSLMDFSVVIKILITSKTIDAFIKESKGDFDNLAPIVQLAIEHDLVSITKKGQIVDLKKLKPIKLNRSSITANPTTPKEKYNQFPCDNDSRLKKANLIFERYPFIEYIRFAIIGDDDFISPFFKNHNFYKPIIIETDQQIVRNLKRILRNGNIYQVDLTNDNEFKTANIPFVKTFITDPPYTINGALLFIYRGLLLLQKDNTVKEFYVVLNQTMIGSYLIELMQILSAGEIFLYETINNFSAYEFPKNYEESRRAEGFLKKIGCHEKASHYSSSSNLYVFRTKIPNTDLLESYIDFKKIYNHYV